MENAGEARLTNAESDQNGRSEYRFVYNRAEIRKETLSSVAGLVILFAFYANFYFFAHARWEKILNDPERLFFFSFPLALVLFWLVRGIFYPRSGVSITINQEGMTCKGFSPRQMPRHCAWDEFSQIDVDYPRESRAPRTLFFTRYSGKRYRLFYSWRERHQYVGVGHSVSLEDALEQFFGSIKPFISVESSSLGVSICDVGKEERLVFYTALGIAFLAIFLLIRSDHPRLLDSALKVPFYWTFGLGAGLLACWYMRRIAKKAFMFMLAPFLGGVVALLFVLLTDYLPLWLGKKESMVFTVVQESCDKNGCTEQRWQAVAEPELTFSIYSPDYFSPDNRAYKGVGAERTMTVYRGPGSLNALPNSEYRALFIERR
jgi:hypothetical protein